MLYSPSADSKTRFRCRLHHVRPQLRRISYTCRASHFSVLRDISCFYILRLPVQEDRGCSSAKLSESTTTNRPPNCERSGPIRCKCLQCELRERLSLESGRGGDQEGPDAGDSARTPTV